MGKRIATAVVGIPVAAAIVTQGGRLFLAAVLLLALVGFYELRNMATKQGATVYAATAGVVTALLVLATGLDMNFLVMPLLSMGTLAILIEGLVNHCQFGEQHWERNVGLSALAMLYVGLLFAHLPLLRGMAGPDLTMCGLEFEYGELALWMVLLGTWASDTFAYFVGSAFGRRKFCSVSPKKSMEGAVGGFIGCVMVVALIGHVGMQFSWCVSMLLGVVIAFAAPIGDLVESICKRSFDIKDSGNFFPGHGGVLDRFDSLLFSAPAAVYVMLAAKALAA